jgi:hypothetical protein
MIRPISVSACIVLASAACAGLTASGASADPLQAGVLECNVAPGPGVIIGSSKDVSCAFHPLRGRPEYYAGRIARMGVDIGLTGPAQVSWNVLMAAPPAHRYALAGDYSGPSIGLALGAGASADSLVGGEGNAITLVPLSGTTTGLDLAAGAGVLSLQPASIPPRHPRHPG